MVNWIKQPLDHLLSNINRSPAFYIWVSVLGALIGLGAYAMLMSLIHSLEIFEFSIKIPWAMMVSSYVFLIGSSTGLCMVASLGYVVGLERYTMIAKRALFLSVVAVISGMTSIVLHLGHPERSAMYTILTPNPRSAMWWMGAFYGIYIVSLVLWCWLLLRRDLLKSAASTGGMQARIYRFLVFEGFLDYLNRHFPKSQRVLEKLSPFFNSEDAELRWTRVIGTLALVSGFTAYITEGSRLATLRRECFGMERLHHPISCWEPYFVVYPGFLQLE